MWCLSGGVEEEKLSQRENKTDKRKPRDEDTQRQRARRVWSRRTGQEKRDEDAKDERDDENREKTKIRTCYQRRTSTKQPQHKRRHVLASLSDLLVTR